MLVFGVLTAGALVAAVGYVAWSALKTEDRETVRPPSAELKLAVSQPPYLVFQHVARDAHYGEVAVTRTDAPGKPIFTGLVCERVYASAGRGICLIPKQEPLGSAVSARFFGTDFRPDRSARLDGITSRARVSPGGRYGAATTFVTGHSYQDVGFSTSTSLIDMAAGKKLADLEDFEVTRDGKPFEAVDFNFWGVTFRPDDRRFYATLQTSGDLYLVEGDVEQRTARVIAKDVECPSLSPDGRRIGYKLRHQNRWRLHVLELATGRSTPLAETRSIDDQVEWLDESRILYGYQGDLWVVQADGRGRPRLFLENALSPAVVRS
jgi:dipeptidyl aminopeptidase/acylaminoacyl peptidase